MDMSNATHLVSAVLELIILIDVSVLWLTGKQVPELLGQLVLAIFATYFASGLTRGRMPAERPERPERGAAKAKGQD